MIVHSFNIEKHLRTHQGTIIIHALNVSNYSKYYKLEQVIFNEKTFYSIISDA